MDNLAQNYNPKQFRAALVACRDSRSKLEALARYGGVDPTEMFLLSRSDDLTLRTLDDIVAAIPESVTLLGLDDAEYLLPEGERNVTRLKQLLEAALIRYSHRGLRITATTSIPLVGKRRIL